MRAPSFWWQERSRAATLLAPVAAVYGSIAGRRLDRPGDAAAVRVICIGNPTVGGAGKTPTALAVARLLIAAGQRPVFLTRGHGGRLAGPVQVDAATHDAAAVGDEPLMLARVAPTIVAADRVKGAAAASLAGASVIVMDDGFQNPSLAKDLAVLVVDGRRGVGNARVFPAGPLRAPLERQLARAHAMLVIGTMTGATSVSARARERGLRVFHGRLAPDREAVATLSGHRALAFAGIGDPEKFFGTLKEAGIEAPVQRAFADHHRYTAREAAALLEEADRHRLVPVTTEKDAARLAGAPQLAALARRATALPIALLIDEAEAFRQLVLDVAAGARL